MKQKILIALMIVVLLFGGWFAYLQFFTDDEVSDTTDSASDTSSQQPTYDPNEIGGLAWVVNKERPLPDDYLPPDLAAPDMKLRWADTAESMQLDTRIIADLEALYKATVNAGFDLMLLSGYRSAEYQAELYNGYVQSAGQEEADRFSAKPGTSEHQTGLTADLGRVDQRCELDECFGELPEGKWLAANAHKYGFIIRYLEGKEESTVYMYEPWHLRYVGKDLAAELYSSGQTMEEYFGL